MAEYQIFISDPDGVRKAPLLHFADLDYSLVVNDWGWFQIVFPEEIFDRSLLEVEAIMEIERKATTASSFNEEFVGFLRKWRYFDDRDGKTNVLLSGMHMNELLHRRSIAYRSQRSEAEKEGLADDVMKAYVRENAGSSAPNDEAGRPRTFGSEFLVAANTGQGPEVSRQGSFKDLLQHLQQISKSTVTMGTPIYFDIRHSRVGGLSVFTFDTYLNFTGTDRSITTGADPVVLSKPRENIADAIYEVDWSDEWNYIWGTGPGEGAGRIIDPEKDVARHTLTKWSRRETTQDARGETTQLGVAIRAFERLQEERPRERFNCRLIDTPQVPYGDAWVLGDKLTTEYLNKQFDGLVKSVRVRVDENGNERIDAQLESDSPATTG